MATKPPQEPQQPQQQPPAQQQPQPTAPGQEVPLAQRSVPYPDHPQTAAGNGGNGRAAPRATASCPANVQETQIAVGKVPQPDVPTANTLPQLWSFTKTNASLATVTPVNETNAADIGKGNEFPSQVFPTNMDTTVALEKYCSSEFMAWLFCFTTGLGVKTTEGSGFQYSAIPNNPALTCINLPPFTWDEQIRPQPNSVVDHALIGCVVGDWTLTMTSGPGRANCRVTCNFPGSGRIMSPGLSPLPAVIQEHFINAAGAFITIAGIDYVANASFMSLEFHWNNNVRLDTGLYPGSGIQNGYAVRGRMEYGIREMTLNFVARAQVGSIEFNNLINQTEGSCLFGARGANFATAGTQAGQHMFDIIIPRARFSSVVNGEDANIVTVQCAVTPLQPPTGDIITMQAATETDAIFGL